MSRDTRHPNRIASLPRGEKHWNYSDTPNKLALHKRLHRKHGKASAHQCFQCDKQAIDWANVTGNYTDDIADYRPSCRSCHVKLDMTQARKDTISAGLKAAYKSGRRTSTKSGVL